MVYYLKNTFITTFNNVIRIHAEIADYLCGSLKKFNYILIIRKLFVVLATIGLWSAYFFQPVWMVSKISYIQIHSETTESVESDFADEEESFELPEASWNEEDPVFYARISFVFNYTFLKFEPQLHKIQLSTFRSSLIEPPAGC